MNTRRATSTQSRDGHVAGAPAPAEDKDGGVVDVSDVDASAPVAPETTQEVPLGTSTEEYDEQAQAELEEERLELQKEQEAYAKIERGLAMAAEGASFLFCPGTRRWCESLANIASRAARDPALEASIQLIMSNLGGTC